MSNNFRGYLLRTSVGIVPNKFIMFDTYETTPLQLIDMDPRRTAEGTLIRNVVANAATTIKFQTVPMFLDDKIAFQAYFPSRESFSLQYWDDHTNSYRTSNFYIPDITWHIHMIKNGQPLYTSTAIEFIGYGEPKA